MAPPRPAPAPPSLLFVGSTLLAGAGLFACATPRGPAEPRLVGAAADSAAAAAADSARATGSARSAQRRFESVRRSHFPRILSRGASSCDEIVGRFCLFFNDGDTWSPKPEPQAVERARDELLARLDSLGDATPTDPWILGHRVRYLVEAARADDALAAARACRAEPAWWCAALEGFALHAQARFPAAEGAFDAALAAMPEAERCRWNDIEVLLDEPGARRAYRETPCVERPALERRFWQLADPLYVEPGNDRRTEHYARHVLDRLQERAASGYGVRWGEDLRELLLRYGWPAGWERDWARPGTFDGGAIVSHDPPGARAFDPPARVLEQPAGASLEGWRLDPRHPRSSYAPPEADTLGPLRLDPLEHQLAVFPRGDSTIVVAAYDMGDSVPANARVEAGLAVGADADTAAVVTRSMFAGPRGALLDTVAARPMMVSVEALARDARRAGRARYGITPPPPLVGGLVVSDLLVFRVGDAVPSTLEEVIPLALGALRLDPDDRLGVYWEVSGLRPGVQATVTLALEREGKSWLRKAVEWVGLANDQSARTRLVWIEERREDAPLVARAVAIEFEGRPAGRYRLTVSVEDPAGRSASASRLITVHP